MSQPQIKELSRNEKVIKRTKETLENGRIKIESVTGINISKGAEDIGYNLVQKDVIISSVIEIMKPKQYNENMNNWKNKLNQWNDTKKMVVAQLEETETAIKYLRTYRNVEALKEFIANQEQGILPKLKEQIDRAESNIAKIELIFKDLGTEIAEEKEEVLVNEPDIKITQ